MRRVALTRPELARFAPVPREAVRGALNLGIGLSNQHGDSSNLCAMERCTLPDLYPTHAPGRNGHEHQR
jgi:hypothetical protein